MKEKCRMLSYVAILFMLWHAKIILLIYNMLCSKAFPQLFCLFNDGFEMQMVYHVIFLSVFFYQSHFLKQVYKIFIHFIEQLIESLGLKSSDRKHTFILVRQLNDLVTYLCCVLLTRTFLLQLCLKKTVGRSVWKLVR